MAKTQGNQSSQPAQKPVAVPDSAMTEYGMTVGDIVKDRDAVYAQREAYQKQAADLTAEVAQLNGSITEKIRQLIAQSERIEKLEAAAKTAPAAPVTPEPTQRIASSGLERLKDGSLRVVVTVPVDQATPLLSWAEGAGEDPQRFIQTQVEEALIAYTSAAYEAK